jgi:hypothetical protein
MSPVVPSDRAAAMLRLGLKLIADSEKFLHTNREHPKVTVAHAGAKWRY